MSTCKRRILVSGINGVIGSELARRLVRSVDEFEICGLFSSGASRNAFMDRGDRRVSARIRPFVCDLADREAVSGLIDGLGPADFAIGVHAAADVSWHRAEAQIRLVNVDGSRHFADLLRRTSASARLIYVSSAFTRAHDWDYRNSYESSKAAGERAIREEYPELDPVTFSCSLVVGSSQDGRISSFHGFYPLMNLLNRYALPVIPGDRDMPIDIVPVDWVADELAALVMRRINRDVREDVVAVAGESNLKVGELTRLVRGELNRHRNWRGVEALPEIAVLPFRQWRFLRRALEAWKVDVEVGDLKKMDRFIEVYRPYLEDGRALPRLNTTTPAPRLERYLPGVIAFWLRQTSGGASRKAVAR